MTSFFTNTFNQHTCLLFLYYHYNQDVDGCHGEDGANVKESVELESKLESEDAEEVVFRERKNALEVLMATNDVLHQSEMNVDIGVGGQHTRYVLLHVEQVAKREQENVMEVKSVKQDVSKKLQKASFAATVMDSI